MNQAATMQLVEAIENDDWDESVQLLKAGDCDVNAKTRDFGHSLLQAAAQHGALEVCQLLLAQRSDVNAEDGSKTTPLMSCIIGGENGHLVSILLKAKANASHQAYDGSTAMSWAKRLHRKQVMHVLKKAGFKKRDSRDSVASISSMVSSELSDAKEDEPPAETALPPQPGLVDQTPHLIEAVESHEWDEAANVLQIEGCNVNARTLDWGHSLLQEAAQHGALEVCQLLLGQRAEVNAVDGTKTTPLMSCVIGGDTGDIVSLLLEARADASIASYNGFTVFQVASRLRRTKAIELLGKAGITDSTQSCTTVQETKNEATKPAGTEPVTDSKQSCTTVQETKKPVTAENTSMLIKAAERNDWNKVAKLLQAGGCDVNARTRDFGHGHPLLQKAASHDATHVCELLLGQRADVNETDESKTTPLMSCIISGDHPKLVKMLLHAKADTSMEAYDGSTALKWAKRLHRHEVVCALKKAGSLHRIVSTSSSNLDSFLSNDEQVEEPAKEAAVPDNTPQLIEFVENDAWDDAAEILQAGGCNVDARTLDFGHSMLQEAAQHGAVDVCRVLLAKRADINAVDGSNTTALTSCILGGDYGEIVSKLLDAKADVTIATQDGTTPDKWANKLRRKNIIGILKQAGHKKEL